MTNQVPVLVPVFIELTFRKTARFAVVLDEIAWVCEKKTVTSRVQTLEELGPNEPLIIDLTIPTSDEGTIIFLKKGNEGLRVDQTYNEVMEKIEIAKLEARSQSSEQVYVGDTTE